MAAANGSGAAERRRLGIRERIRQVSESAARAGDIMRLKLRKKEDSEITAAT